MNEIVLTNANGTTYTSKTLRFSGGELQVSFPTLGGATVGPNEVLARLQCPEDVIRLLLAKEALDRIVRGSMRLIVPYFPYARQDRVMRRQEAFSLKPIAALVNAMRFDGVTICDPHSDVTPALLDRVEVIPQLDLVLASGALDGAAPERTVIVAPDAGAAKKAHSIAHQTLLPMVTASKIRDVLTGAITGTSIADPSAVAGRDTLIVDDICDGGRTFIELAKALRTAGARTVRLYVTHGIFSQGFTPFEGLIDVIYTTDSFLSDTSNGLPVPGMPLHVSSCRTPIRYEY